MPTVAARAVTGPAGRFETIRVDRRALRAADVEIAISYAGICHTDVHRARAEFGRTVFPIVPGHEIAGVVAAVGEDVTRFRVGDRVGVGCMVGSCRVCEACRRGMEQYCEVHHVLTYNDVDGDGHRTYGGYSERIVVDEHFVVRIPDALPLERAAPLLCAGITLYSPLRRWSAGPGREVAIVGFGGLGHVGVQLARALGARTTVFELRDDARADALRLGADEFRVGADPATAKELAGRFDLIVSTVPATYDLDAMLRLLAVDGTLVNLGVPTEPLSVVPHSLLVNRRSLAGSLIGGMAETQEMLDFCAEHGIGAEVELVDSTQLDEGYDRLTRGEVRYRLVLDVATIRTLTPPAADAPTAPR